MKYLLVMFSALLFGCADSKEYVTEGEDFRGDAAVPVEELISLVSEESSPFKVQGVVKEVCQSKGCWMTLQTENAENVRVTFKDYGFFMPKDLAGKTVIINGEAVQELISEELARHYAEDGGLEYSEDQRKSITFVASGVKYEKGQSQL